VLSRTGGSSAQTATQAPNAGPFETMLAAKLGVSLDTLHTMESAAQATLADKGVASGQLTAAQAAALKSYPASPLLEQAFAAVAAASGTSGSDLFNRLAGGETLAQIASSNGINAGDLKTNLTSSASTMIGSGVTFGIISQSQADEANAFLAQNIDKLINSPVPQHDGLRQHP
jgi:hypothetical protein